MIRCLDGYLACEDRVSGEIEGESRHILDDAADYSPSSLHTERALLLLSLAEEGGKFEYAAPFIQCFSEGRLPVASAAGSPDQGPIGSDAEGDSAAALPGSDVIRDEVAPADVAEAAARCVRRLLAAIVALPPQHPRRSQLLQGVLLGHGALAAMVRIVRLWAAGQAAEKERALAAAGDALLSRAGDALAKGRGGGGEGAGSQGEGAVGQGQDEAAKDASSQAAGSSEQGEEKGKQPKKKKGKEPPAFPPEWAVLPTG